jgi:hypothetical protein
MVLIDVGNLVGLGTLNDPLVGASDFIVRPVELDVGNCVSVVLGILVGTAVWDDVGPVLGLTLSILVVGEVVVGFVIGNGGDALIGFSVGSKDHCTLIGFHVGVLDTISGPLGGSMVGALLEDTVGKYVVGVETSIGWVKGDDDRGTPVGVTVSGFSIGESYGEMLGQANGSTDGNVSGLSVVGTVNTGCIVRKSTGVKIGCLERTLVGDTNGQLVL